MPSVRADRYPRVAGGVAVPPVQAVRPGIWLHRHVLPPSCDHPMRSLRAVKPRSCCQVPMGFGGCAGLTAIAGSISSPATCVLSSAAPGQPPANGLGPHHPQMPAAPGPELATAGDTLPARRSPLAAAANPAVAKNSISSHTPPASPRKRAICQGSAREIARHNWLDKPPHRGRAVRAAVVIGPLPGQLGEVQRQAHHAAPLGSISQHLVQDSGGGMETRSSVGRGATT